MTASLINNMNGSLINTKIQSFEAPRYLTYCLQSGDRSRR